MSCTRHPSKESVGACSNCGKLVCTACYREKEGKTYCYVCEEKLFPAGEAAVVIKPESVIPLAAPQAVPAEDQTPVTATPAIVEPKEQPAAPEKVKTPVTDIKTSPEPTLPVIGGINILWYIAVFFFGWIGGLAAWWKNKKQAPQTSRYLLFGSIGWSVLQGALTAILIVALIMPPAFKPVIKWPSITSKPPAVTEESEWIEGDASGQAALAKRYIPPQVKRTETGTIITDTPVELAATSVDTAGGTVTVDKLGDPLNGLQITVPDGAYTDSRTFKVSSAPITINTFGNGVNPISPMISVENGGGSAATAMTLKVPLQVPEGQSVIWYYYDPKSGTLEAAPVIAIEKDSVTVSVTHFSEGFFSSIVEALMPTEIDSGFRPGVDSWQFGNPGTCVNPNGNCEGMSMGAMWYYFTRPDGSDKSLYGRYDNNGAPNPPTKSIWQDDAYALRFCSVLQEDYANHMPQIPVWKQNPGAAGTAENWTADRVWDNWMISGGDNLTRRLFESAMLSTHEPQAVRIHKLGGGGAHAMVVYKIVDGTLIIYDPNIPGGTGEIKWENGRYLPYTGAFASPWGWVTYEAKSTLINDWNKIQGFWGQLKNGTIGDSIFPAYKVTVVDDKGDKDELKDGYETTDGSIKLEFDNPQLKFNVYSADPLFLKSPKNLSAAADGKYYLTDQGETMLGIYVTDQHDEWVDFKWYKVKSGTADAEVKIEAPGQQGFANDPCTFKAVTKNIPKDARLEWYFAGQAGEQGTKYRDTDSVTHTFTTSGEKTIICQVVKDKVVKPLAKDTVTYKVVQPPLDIIANPPKGAVKQTCTFQPARSNPLPEDAKYTWSFGNGKSSVGEEASTTYDESKTYTVSVTATWVNKLGKVPTQEHTYGELKYEVVDALPLKIIASPATGIAGEKTAFSIQGENIPENVAFYWEFGDANSEGDLSTEQKDGAAGHTYTKEGTYEVKVSMLDKKNPKPLAQATLRYNVEPPVTLAIVAPDEIKQGKGITNKNYTFKSTWEQGKAPAGVSYIWSYHGSTLGKDADMTNSFGLGHFTIELKAQWKDMRGAAREAVATPLDFDITVESAFVIVAMDNALQQRGTGVIEKEYTFTTDWSPKNAPAGVSYVWSVDGGGVEDQGGKIPYTFKTEGKHTVSARAAWKDDKGNTQTADNNRIFALSMPALNVLLTCTDADIQNNKKGVTKKDYTFNVSWDTGKAPAGVKYRWFVNGNETGKTGITETFKFADEDEYRLNVQADWDTPAGKHEWSLGQMIFKIETPTNFSVRCADSGLQASHKGVPDKDYRFYTFWGEGGSAPEGTSYAWFLNDEETGDTGEDAHFTLSADTTGAAKPYTVKATAKWTDASGNEKNTSASISFDIGAAPTLSIKVPDEITSGKGVINKQYSFSVTANNIPADAEYTWYSGGEAKKQGKDLKSVTNTFAATADYVLKVEAKWTDAGGKAQSATSPEVEFHIGGAATITLNAPAEIKANKGVKGQKYQFSVTAVNIPAGAEYAWYSNDQEKNRGKDFKSGSISFSEAIDYTMRVEANWTDSRGESQSVSSPEVTFHINDVFTVTLTVPAEIKAGKGVKGQKYSFSVTTENIPKGAEYTWYSNGEAKNSGTDYKSGSISFSEAIDYTMKVEARWKDSSGKAQSAVSPNVKFHINEGATVAVIPPAELSKGAALQEKSYYFSAQPQGVPTNAEYTWYVNDKSLGKASKDKSPAVKTDKEPKDYVVKVVASWKANNQPQQVFGTYAFSTLTGMILTYQQVISGTGTCMMDNPSQFANTFMQPIFSKVNINVVNGKAIADQTVSFTSEDKWKMPVTAKVKINGNVKNNIISGTFLVDSVVTWKDNDGKSIPIDLKYSGNFTSTQIPAKPAGQSLTLTFTGPVQSKMLIQILVAVAKAAGGALACMGKEGSSSTGEQFVPPENDNICSSFTTKVQYTITQSGK